MKRTNFTLALLLCLSFLCGYSVMTKGQQKSEPITAIDGKSAKGKDMKNRARLAEYKTGKTLTDPDFFAQQSDEIVVDRCSNQ